MVNIEDNKEGLVVYELGFLALPSIPEDKLSEVMNTVRQVITKAGGVEIDAEAPVKQPLAYSMSKTVGASHYVVNEAYLGWIKFEVERAQILAIKSNVEKIESILRFILIKAPRETTFTLVKVKASIDEKDEGETDVEEGIKDPSPVEEAVVE